jgi:pimeloyl-ACP methyl ester carboxylesterase
MLSYPWRIAAAAFPTPGASMRVAPFSRRSLAGAVLAMSALALLGAAAPALAAPFESSRIIVRTEGSGPDVVLIPGLNSSPRVWAEAVAALPGYRYHLVQLKGFAGLPSEGNGEGKSDGPVAAPVAEEIDRYIREAGLGQPAVVGHSMGGTIGLMLAARHPGDLSRLMVVDMLPFLGAMFGGPGASAAGVRPIADRIAAGIRSATPEERARRGADTIKGMLNNEAMRPAANQDSQRSDPQVSARAYHELIVTDLTPELRKIAVPLTVLYVSPPGSPLPAAQLDAVYKAAYSPVKQLTLTRVPDSAHFIMRDQPAGFQQALQLFLGGR